MSEMIYRSLPSENFQTREAEDGKKYIEGYFSVYDSPYHVFDGADEFVARGAFTNSLEHNDIRALINHDDRLVIGRTTAGTLELRDDTHGLYGRIEINEKDTDAMNLYERVARRDVSGCSFGFNIRAEETEYLDDGSVRWILRDVDLHEVSVVTFPAYEATNVDARKRDYEEIVERRNALWREEMLKKLKGESNGTENADAEEKP